LFYAADPHHHLLSFPTRRYSDLWDGVPLVLRDRGEITFQIGELLLDLRPLLAVLLDVGAQLGLAIVLALLVHSLVHGFVDGVGLDRKSTRLNSSHSQISYADFCL